MGRSGRRRAGDGLRLALLSDIHGNEIALNAVLADIEEQGGVDEYWVLGDFAAIGYEPCAVIEYFLASPGNARFVRGNTDRHLVTGERPGPSPADVERDPSLLPGLLQVRESLAWTLGAVCALGYWDWLAQLPLEQRRTLPDGTRLLGVHAAPGADDGPGIHPGLSDAELEALLAGCAADLVVVGHTHVPLDRTAGGVRAVNLGSVSNPLTADLRASYALLEATGSGYTLEMRRVEYDRDEVIREIEASRHPTPGFLIQYMRGEMRSRWVSDA